MTSEKAVIIRPSGHLATRPARALARFSPRQILPAAGVALALTWSAGKVVSWLIGQRRASIMHIERAQPVSHRAAPQAVSRISYARWSVSITIHGRGETDTHR